MIDPFASPVFCTKRCVSRISPFRLLVSASCGKATSGSYPGSVHVTCALLYTGCCSLISGATDQSPATCAQHAQAKQSKYASSPSPVARSLDCLFDLDTLCRNHISSQHTVDRIGAAATATTTASNGASVFLDATIGGAGTASARER